MLVDARLTEGGGGAGRTGAPGAAVLLVGPCPDGTVVVDGAAGTSTDSSSDQSVARGRLKVISVLSSTMMKTWMIVTCTWMIVTEVGVRPGHSGP